MIVHPEAKPRLRPVEAAPGLDQGTVGVRDPSGLSATALTVTEPALFILSLLDGDNTLTQIQDHFRDRYHQPLAFDTLAELVDRLDTGLLLEGPTFEAHYRSLVEQYRAAGARPMRDAAALGLDGDADQLFAEMLADAAPSDGQAPISGLIAPHLDYARGRPCYAEAYAALARCDPPDRFVILGTNHFGRGSSVVATGLDFATPLGTTPNDRAFLEEIEKRCGDLRQWEYDHAAEHSIELQVCWLQHLYGAQRFSIVPFLCPDPCGPSGTKPYDGNGVDLADFSRVLRETIAEDDNSTVVIAGADLSHVGGFFGDDRSLDDGFCREVRQRDQAVLACVESVDADALRECVAKDQNPTRICSAGCIYTMLAVLPDARAEVLRYHQALTAEAKNCVTCSAAVFRK